MFLSNGRDPALVHPSQLTEAARNVADVSLGEDTLTWFSTDRDWNKLLNGRFLQFRSSYIDGDIDLSPSVSRILPFLTDSRGSRRIASSPSLQAWLNASKPVTGIEEIKEKVEAEDWDGLKELLKSLTETEPDLPSLMELAVRQTPTRYLSGVGPCLIVGLHEDLLVMDVTVEGRQFFVLVPKDQVLDRHRGALDEILPRLPKQDWTDKLTLDPLTWQHYQYHPSVRQLGVVERVRPGMVWVRNLDGSSRSHPPRGQEAYFEKVIIEGQTRRLREAKKLPAWTLAESEQILYGQVIGQTRDDIEIVDVNGDKSLFAKYNLSDERSAPRN